MSRDLSPVREEKSLKVVIFEEKKRCEQKRYKNLSYKSSDVMGFKIDVQFWSLETINASCDAGFHSAIENLVCEPKQKLTMLKTKFSSDNYFFFGLSAYTVDKEHPATRSPMINKLIEQMGFDPGLGNGPIVLTRLNESLTDEDICTISNMVSTLVHKEIENEW
jgi:hypothetical protein